MRIFSKLLLVFLFMNTEVVFSQPQARIWKANEQDAGIIHSLGNGAMCVYEQGPDLVTVYSGPLSTPSFYRLQMIGGDSLQVYSSRERGTAIWCHQILSGAIQTGEMLDYVAAEMPCFVRSITTDQRIAIQFRLEKYVRVIENSSRWQNHHHAKGLLLVVPSGTLIYQTYVYPRILYNQLLCQGAVSVQKTVDPFIYELICEKGASQICLIGGPEYPQVIGNCEQALALTHEKMLRRTRAFWQEFTARRTDFSIQLPARLPQREKLLQTIDDIAVLIKTQQSNEGAVLAGYPYPLGYVRDQYGVSRGLLSLGCFPEAKKILQFYWQVWQKFGRIHNAQAIGVDGIFHIHENDDVESTAYLIVQAFDLAAATGDEAFLREIFPMLEWAFSAQKKHLVDGMLPFNGDETYVAGGLLPRSALNDGSAEATLLFIESGERFIPWIEKSRLWSSEKIAENKYLLALIRKKFKKNFYRDGILWTNNPHRMERNELPKFRHGVCEKRGSNCLMKTYDGVVWTERNEHNRYLCAACLSEGTYPETIGKRLNLPSVVLMPFYLHSRIMDAEELRPTIEEILAPFKKDETIISNSVAGQQVRRVGYEYGLLLNALTELELPEAALMYEKTLALRDEVGSWSEYYLNDVPNGTRCRPWESAINLEALIAWAKKQK